MIHELKESEVTVCYNGEEKEECEIDDFAAIASRIELLLKKKEQKEAENEENEENSELCSKIQVQKVSFGDFKKERRSFGIPLIPPIQDMSAFYIE